ncbi:hypothetical protein [Oceanobacillus neutriphilus]|nr:hypothetical protein [Oceanobacillus neutriphilus]
MKSIKKRFKKKDVIHDFSFDIRAGECIGLIGPKVERYGIIS